MILHRFGSQINFPHFFQPGEPNYVYDYDYDFNSNPRAGPNGDDASALTKKDEERSGKKRFKVI